MLRTAGGDHTGQAYVERPPAPALSGAVISLWVQHVAPGAAPYTHRTVPNGSAELIVRLGDEAHVRGPRTVPAVDTLAPGATVIGVRFRPGAAEPVLGLPAGELRDLTVGAADVWGPMAATLGERVATATPDGALQSLEAEIARRLDRATAPDPVVAATVDRLMPWRGSGVSELPRALAISERQLRRRCHAALGVGPKALQRLLRFQGFLALVQRSLATTGAPPTDNLARLAADAGYADQAHLSRECVRLMGISPTAFLHEATHQCAPSHDHRASFAPMLGQPAVRSAG
jgi:AraC-like DNA-binding protein